MVPCGYSHGPKAVPGILGPPSAPNTTMLGQNMHTYPSVHSVWQGPVTQMTDVGVYFCIKKKLGMMSGRAHCQGMNIDFSKCIAIA